MERGEPAFEEAQAEPRVRLDRARILDAAQTVAVREGLDGLTMRALGTELDADPTALYRHFRNKQELLMELADRQFDGIGETGVGDDWRERLRAMSRALHDRYVVSQDLAVLMSRQTYTHPSLRHVLEETLAILREAGLSPEQAAGAFHLIEAHVVGFGLFYAVAWEDNDPVEANRGARRETATLDAAQFPRSVETAPYLFGDPDDVYAASTELLIDAIERMARGSAGAPNEESTA